MRSNCYVRNGDLRQRDSFPVSTLPVMTKRRRSTVGEFRLMVVAKWGETQP